MKYLTSFYRISLLVTLAAILAVSCDKDEEVATILQIKEGQDKIWEAKPLGDTINITFETNLPHDKIRINNPLEWVDFKLFKDELRIYVKPNTEIGKRTGNIGLMSVEKGIILANNIIKISQESEQELAEVKYLYTHFTKIKSKVESEFHDENRVFNTIIPEKGGEVDFEHIFACNISKEDLEVELKYEDETTQNWIKKTEFIETEKGIEGIRVFVDKLPEKVMQRKVEIVVRDKKFKDLNASISCSQFKQLVKLANPKDRVITIPIRPTELSVLLKTELSAEQIQVSLITAVLDGYESPEPTQEEFEQRVADPIFMNNYMDDFEENEDEQEYYEIKETANGLVLKGLTTSTNCYFFESSWYDGPYRRFIRISNEVNDQKIFILMEEEKMKDNYIFFSGDKKEISLSMSAEGGSLEIPEITSNSVNEMLYVIYPEWTNRTEMDRGWELEQLELSYPDIITVEDGAITVQANTFREKRTGIFEISYSGLTHNILNKPTTYEGSPLKIKLEQEGFSGTYIFKQITDVENPMLFSNGGEVDEYGNAPSPQTKSIALKTNLRKEQIQIIKTERAGWIDYKFNEDGETGYVKSVLFYIDYNPTGEDRTVSVTLKAPENEGLQEIQFNFKQSK